MLTFLVKYKSVLYFWNCFLRITVMFLLKKETKLVDGVRNSSWPSLFQADCVLHPWCRSQLLLAIVKAWFFRSCYFFYAFLLTLSSLCCCGRCRLEYNTYFFLSSPLTSRVQNELNWFLVWGPNFSTDPVCLPCKSFLETFEDDICKTLKQTNGLIDWV